MMTILLWTLAWLGSGFLIASIVSHVEAFITDREKRLAFKDVDFLCSVILWPMLTAVVLYRGVRALMRRWLRFIAYKMRWED